MRQLLLAGKQYDEQNQQTTAAQAKTNSEEDESYVSGTGTYSITCLMRDECVRGVHQDVPHVLSTPNVSIEPEQQSRLRSSSPAAAIAAALSASNAAAASDVSMELQRIVDEEETEEEKQEKEEDKYQDQEDTKEMLEDKMEEPSAFFENLHARATEIADKARSQLQAKMAVHMESEEDVCAIELCQDLAAVMGILVHCVHTIDGKSVELSKLGASSLHAEQRARESELLEIRSEVQELKVAVLGCTSLNQELHVNYNQIFNLEMDAMRSLVEGKLSTLTDLILVLQQKQIEHEGHAEALHRMSHSCCDSTCTIEENVRLPTDGATNLAEVLHNINAEKSLDERTCGHARLYDPSSSGPQSGGEIDELALITKAGQQTMMRRIANPDAPFDAWNQVSKLSTPAQTDSHTPASSGTRSPESPKTTMELHPPKQPSVPMTIQHLRSGTLTEAALSLSPYARSSPTKPSLLSPAPAHTPVKEVTAPASMVQRFWQGTTSM